MVEADVIKNGDPDNRSPDVKIISMKYGGTIFISQMTISIHGSQDITKRYDKRRMKEGRLDGITC